MKLSFTTFGYGSFLPWVPAYTIEEAVKRIAWFGYDGIEIGASRPHAWPSDIDSEDRKKLKKMINSYDLEIAAICPVVYEFNLASCIKNERKDTIKYYIDCIQLAADLESKVVVFVPGWSVYPTSYEESWKWLKEGIHKISDRTRDLDVSMAIEPINSYWVNLVTRTDDALRLIKEVSLKNVKVMLDTQHLYLERENPTDAVEKCKELLVHIHIADTTSVSSERVVPGKGNFGFESFINALKKVEYKYYLSAELWGPNPDQIALENIKYLKTLI
jgi:protein FrlC